MSETLDVPDGAGGVVPFQVEGLSRSAWTDLIHQHPTENARWRWNPDTFYPALIAACVLAPIVDVEWATALVDDIDCGAELIEICLRLSDPGSLDWARHRLAADARLNAEVGAAIRMGISHEAFLGWAPRSQELALAWIENDEQARCPGCGVPRADMAKPMAWEPDLRPCAHCDTLHTARKGVAEGNRHREHIVLVPARTT